jgi:hypothetical protein
MTSIRETFGHVYNHHLPQEVTEAPARSRADRALWTGFLVVLAASVMDLLDSTITQTAAPAIRRELGGSYADVEWFTAAYTLAMSASLMLPKHAGAAAH